MINIGLDSVTLLMLTKASHVSRLVHENASSASSKCSNILSINNFTARKRLRRRGARGRLLTNPDEFQPAGYS